MTGPDGNLWFEEIFCCPALGIIAKATPSGTVTEVVNIDSLENIATGPDGNIWFIAEPAVLGKMTPSGAMQTFTAHSTPRALITGPDNNLWVISFDSSEIDVYSTSGVFLHSFATNVISNTFVTSVAVGPDGNVWLSVQNVDMFATNDFIVRMALDGTTTAFSVPLGGIWGIATGPDGNLWFCMFNTNQIGRFTTTGVLTLFDLPTPSSHPRAIAAGPDGNVWFTETQGNNIGRIAPNGRITEFPIPTPASDPEGISAGPDGFMWFTELDGLKIAKIHP